MQLLMGELRSIRLKHIELSNYRRFAPPGATLRLPSFIGLDMKCFRYG